MSAVDGLVCVAQKCGRDNTTHHPTIVRPSFRPPGRGERGNSNRPGSGFHRLFFLSLTPTAADATRPHPKSGRLRKRPPSPRPPRVRRRAQCHFYTVQGRDCFNCIITLNKSVLVGGKMAQSHISQHTKTYPQYSPIPNRCKQPQTNGRCAQT